MSQFNTNQGFGGQSGYDPLGSLTGLGGSPFTQGGRNQGGMRNMGRRQAPQTSTPLAPPPNSRGNRQFIPRQGGTMGIVAQQGGPDRNRQGQGFGRVIPQQYLNFDAALANAMGTDIRNQQGAMNEMFQRNERQIGLTEDALQRGIGTLQESAQTQRTALEGIAGGLEKQGQQGYDEFKQFRDRQMGAVDRDIEAANRQAGQAVSSYEQTISQFKDTSAQDAANAAFGLRQNAKSQMAEIDMLDASPAEKAALKQQLSADVSNQVTQTVTGIFSNMNQNMASMGSNLASLKMGQSQQTLAGGQLRGQMGTSFGAQTLDAQRMNQQMREVGAQLRAAGENAVASAMQQSVMFEMNGRQTIAQMIQANPRQFVSLFAGLTGYIAGATTPGLRDISVPDFGAIV